MPNEAKSLLTGEGESSFGTIIKKALYWVVNHIASFDGGTKVDPPKMNGKVHLGEGGP